MPGAGVDMEMLETAVEKTGTLLFIFRVPAPQSSDFFMLQSTIAVRWAIAIAHLTAEALAGGTTCRLEH